MGFMNLGNLRSGKLERRKQSKRDWLGLIVLISAAGIAGFFIFAQIGMYYYEVLQNGSAVKFHWDRFIFEKNKEKSSPQETYRQAREALLNNDLEGVLETIHPAYVYKYKGNLEDAHKEGELPMLGNRMMPLTEKVYDDGTSVVYKTEHIPGNDSPNPLERYGESVEFTVDGSGIWKISSI